MEIEPLLVTHTEDDSFRLDFMKVGWREDQEKKVKGRGELELVDMMGQPFSRNNKVIDWIEQENRMSNSEMKSKFFFSDFINHKLSLNLNS